MDDPVFAPDVRLHKREQTSLFQLVAKLGAEDWRESFDGDEKVWACRAPMAVISQTTTGDDVMYMRMIEKLAGPGVEYADHAEAGADEAWVLGQLQ